MAERFTGEIYQKVDAKARVSIPADFRAILKELDPSAPDAARPRLQMVYGGPARSFVECFGKEIFEGYASEIEAIEDEEDRNFAELNMVTRSVKVEIEPDGRIVLPQRVREKIGLGDEVQDKAELVFVGKSDRFHIYRRDVYDAKFVNVAKDEKDDQRDPFSVVKAHRRKG